MGALSSLELFTMILASTVIIVWLYWLWTRRHFYRLSQRFPTFWGLPLLGIGLQTVRAVDLLPTFGRLLDKSAIFTCFTWLGTHPVLLTSSPEFIEQVLTSSQFLNKTQTVYGLISAYVGNGIITSTAEKWQYNRKLINPTFGHKVLLSLLPIFHESKVKLIECLNTLDDGKVHNIFETLQRSTLGISIQTTMGKKIDEGDVAENEKFVSIFKVILEQGIKHILFELLGFGWYYNIKDRELRCHLQKFVRKLVDKKLSKVTDDVPQQSFDLKYVHENVECKKTPNIFIDHAIKLYQRQQLDLNDVTNESNHIVMAAFETTANSLFSTLIMLAMHPEIQERLFQEIYEIFPNKDFQMEYEHLQQLPYLDMVINEVLRLAPPLPIIGRQVTKDTYITEDIMLPKDLEIYIAIHHLHRRKDIWGPNADKFDPNNFLAANAVGKHPYAFIPFSKGSRNCIGWRYALFTIKIFVTSLVRNFEFSTDFLFEDLQLVENITLKYFVEPGIRIQRRKI